MSALEPESEGGRESVADVLASLEALPDDEAAAPSGSPVGWSENRRSPRGRASTPRFPGCAANSKGRRSKLRASNATSLTRGAKCGVSKLWRCKRATIRTNRWPVCNAS